MFLCNIEGIAEKVHEFHTPGTVFTSLHHFIFFLIFEWVQKAGVLHYTRLWTKRASSFGAFVSDKENEVL
jgi:hypothetical protein